MVLSRDSLPSANTTFDLSLSRIKPKQHSDPDILPIINHLSTGLSDPQFALQDDAFFCFVPPCNAATSSRVPFLPTPLVTLVLRTCHDHPLSGQLSVHRTLTHILSRFWWPNMYQSVQNVFITILSARNLMDILNLFQFPLQYFEAFICICEVLCACLHLVEVAM